MYVCWATGVTRTGRKPECKYKPNIVLEYNKSKQGIDLSDQISSYQTAVRKSMRWYHKVIQELLLGTSVVNARILYNEYNRSVPGFGIMSILDFKEKLIYSLLDQEASRTSVKCPKKQHALVELEERTSDNRRKRKYCTHCYSKLASSASRTVALNKTKQVSTYCNKCPDAAPLLCLDCFRELHK